MAQSNLLKELLIWITKTFGKDILIVAKDTLQHTWARLFKARSILILGDRQTGKTSLLYYLTQGSPYEVVDGERRAPDRTAMAAIVNEKFHLQRANWLRLKRDVPGDLNLRETWAQAIEDVRPYGIIFMVDGRLGDNDFRNAVPRIRPDVLSHYESATRELVTVHVFINFADRWAISSAEMRRSKLRLVEDALYEAVDGNESLQTLRLGCSATQMSPNKNEWHETYRAVHHFGADLAG